MEQLVARDSTRQFEVHLTAGAFALCMGEDATGVRRALGRKRMSGGGIVSMLTDPSLVTCPACLIAIRVGNEDEHQAVLRELAMQDESVWRATSRVAATKPHTPERRLADLACKKAEGRLTEKLKVWSAWMRKSPVLA